MNRPGFPGDYDVELQEKERRSHRDPMNATKPVLTSFKRFTELNVDLASNAPLSGPPPKEPPAARPVESRREGAVAGPYCLAVWYVVVFRLFMTT